MYDVVSGFENIEYDRKMEQKSKKKKKVCQLNLTMFEKKPTSLKNPIKGRNSSSYHKGEKIDFWRVLLLPIAITIFLDI